MKKYTYKDAPLKVFGVPFFEEKKVLERVPSPLRDSIENYDTLGRKCSGARVAFRTNAEEFTVEVTLESLNVDAGMSLYACQSAEVLIGKRNNARFAGLISPPDYNTPTFSNTIRKSNEMEDVTIFLPSGEPIVDFTITFPDEAIVEAPTPYKYGPVLYYGSSITDGCSSTRLSNSYNALLSNRLDVDYYNFGFPGSARGELSIADYINTIDMKAFILDYDHNAASPQDLRDTHEAFFKRIREKNPDIPVIMMSRPNFVPGGNDAKRREVVFDTYKNALESGDKNVYFIDGESFFGDTDRQACTVDTIHPNDLGFYRMAAVIEPVLRKALGI